MCNCNKSKILTPEQQAERESRKEQRLAELTTMREEYEQNLIDNPDYIEDLEKAGICAYCGHAKSMCICD